MSAPTAKKQKTGEKEAASVATAVDLDEDAHAEQLTAASKVQDEIEKVDELAGEEVIAIENKYNKQRAPLIKKREQILRQIPFFWSRLLSNFEDYEDIHTDADDLLLMDLVSVECIELEDIRKGWDLIFHFKPESECLKETYVFTKQIRRDGAANTTTEQTLPQPKWQKGKDLTSDADLKKLKIKGGGISFFKWFFGEGTEPSQVEEQFEGTAEKIKGHLHVDPLKCWEDGSDGSDEGELELEGEEGEDGDDVDGEGGEEEEGEEGA